jgi:hypothetical protein
MTLARLSEKLRIASADRGGIEMTAGKRTLTAFVLSVGLVGHGIAWAQSNEPITIDDVQAELSDVYGAIARYSLQERDEALDAAEQSLDRIDAEIDVLENRARENWEDMSQAARDRTSAALQDLRARRNRLGEMYGAMTHGTDAAWDELVAGFTNAWDELSAAWTVAVDDANSNTDQ